MGMGWPGAKSQYGEEDGQVGRLLAEIRVPCVPEWLHARSCSKFMLQKVSLYFFVLFSLPPTAHRQPENRVNRFTCVSSPATLGVVLQLFETVSSSVKWAFLYLP